MILKMEDDVGWVFFRLPVSTLTPTSDSEALSCLSYQGKAHYYALTREDLCRGNSEANLAGKTARPRRAMIVRNGHRISEKN